MPIRRVVHAGTELGNSASTLLTFSTGIVQGGAVVVAATITNRATVRRRATLYLIESGGSVGAAKPIYDEYVPPGRTVSAPGGPWFEDGGATVQGLSDAASSAVAVRLTAFEEFQE